MGLLERPIGVRLAPISAAKCTLSCGNRRDSAQGMVVSRIISSPCARFSSKNGGAAGLDAAIDSAASNFLSWDERDFGLAFCGEARLDMANEA